MKFPSNLSDHFHDFLFSLLNPNAHLISISPNPLEKGSAMTAYINVAKYENKINYGGKIHIVCLENYGDDRMFRNLPVFISHESIHLTIHKLTNSNKICASYDKISRKVDDPIEPYFLVAQWVT